MRPPGPTSQRLLRGLPTIARFAPDFLQEMAAEFGPVVAFPVPEQAVFLAASPEGAWDVLVRDHPAWGKETPQYVSLASLTGAGLLTADGDGWLRRRRMLAPVFTRGGLPLVAARSLSAADDLVAAVGDTGADGVVVDVEHLLLLASLDVVSTSAIDADGDGVATPGRAGLVEAVVTGLDCVIADVRAPQPLPRWVPTPRRRRMAAALRRLDEASAAMVEGRRAESVGRPVADNGAPDMLGTLLAALDDVADPMTDAHVRDELVTAVVAGHETVASSLTWTLWLLATHPQAQARLRVEALECGKALETATMAEMDDAGLARLLNALPFTRAVVDEGLRLYPPAWVITRRSTRVTEVAGQPVPAGALAIVCPWQLHRDPGVWPDPERFRPERFLAGPDGSADGPDPKPPRGAYLPFGAGPRLCIGRDLALVESVVVLASLLRDLRVDPTGPRPRPQALVTVRPQRGLPLRVTRV